MDDSCEYGKEQANLLPTYCSGSYTKVSPTQCYYME